MIADFTQLHQNVDDTHEVTSCQRLLRSDHHKHYSISPAIYIISIRQHKNKSSDRPCQPDPIFYSMLTTCPNTCPHSVAVVKLNE